MLHRYQHSLNETSAPTESPPPPISALPMRALQRASSYARGCAFSGRGRRSRVPPKPSPPLPVGSRPNPLILSPLWASLLKKKPAGADHRGGRLGGCCTAAVVAPGGRPISELPLDTIDMLCQVGEDGEGEAGVLEREQSIPHNSAPSHFILTLNKPSPWAMVYLRSFQLFAQFMKSSK